MKTDVLIEKKSLMKDSPLNNNYIVNEQEVITMKKTLKSLKLIKKIHEIHI